MGSTQGRFPPRLQRARASGVFASPGLPSERQAVVSHHSKRKKELPESWLWQSFLAIAASRRWSGATAQLSHLVWGDGSAIALGLERARARQAMMLVKLMELQLKI